MSDLTGLVQAHGAIQKLIDEEEKRQSERVERMVHEMQLVASKGPTALQAALTKISAEAKEYEGEAQKIKGKIESLKAVAGVMHQAAEKHE